MNFTIKKIPNLIQNRMLDSRVWQESCPINIDKLALLEISHYNFEGNVQKGEIVVLAKIAKNVISIFKELYEIKFPIHSMKLIDEDEFQGNDELSMSANNSSCFNFRNIEGTDLISMHSYGLAIDINPLQNPYIINNNSDNNPIILPKESKNFLDRRAIRAGMVEPIVDIFKKHGFTEWGGEWNSPIDYHHFQVSREKISKLIK